MVWNGGPVLNHKKYLFIICPLKRRYFDALAGLYLRPNRSVYIYVDVSMTALLVQMRQRKRNENAEPHV